MLSDDNANSFISCLVLSNGFIIKSHSQLLIEIALK